MLEIKENWNSWPNSTGQINAIGQPSGPTIRLTPKCIPKYSSWIKKVLAQNYTLSKKKLPPPPKKKKNDHFGGRG